jgi:hypothetical protein
MSQNATKMRLEDLEIKPQLITKLRGAGIESIFDLAISIPHQLIEEGGILTGADAQIALDLVTKAKKAIACQRFFYSRRNFRKKKKSAEMYYWIFKFRFILEGRY